MLVFMFDRNRYLTEKRERINEALETVLPSETMRPFVLHKAMRHSVLSGGKRLRPIMALAAAEAVDSNADAAINAAVSIELLHTYTLIHDDLPSMDDDDERRGRPTCHILYGEANAILAGDALQALAFEIAARTTAHPPYSPTQIVTELALAAGSCGVVGGQVEDIAHDDKKMDAETIEYIHLHKTADLFRAAIRMGAIAGGANQNQLDILTQYAIDVGRAFQIIDDLLDDTSADDEDNDLSRSCVGIYGKEKAKTLAKDLTADALSCLSKLDSATQPLKAIAEYMIERTY